MSLCLYYYSIIITKLAGLFTSWITLWINHKCSRCSAYHTHEGAVVSVRAREWNYPCLQMKKSLTVPTYLVMIKVYIVSLMDILCSKVFVHNFDIQNWTKFSLNIWQKVKKKNILMYKTTCLILMLNISHCYEVSVFLGVYRGFIWKTYINILEQIFPLTDPILKTWTIIYRQQFF